MEGGKLVYNSNDGSQSPQIGSMFPTEYRYWLQKRKVAIPSNRVNVSYVVCLTKSRLKLWKRSQSPQIGSMFPTSRFEKAGIDKIARVAIPSNRVNVSYSHYCYHSTTRKKISRNPLKSGQCFLQHPSFSTHYRKLNTPFAGTSLFLCFPFPYLTYLLP